MYTIDTMQYFDVLFAVLDVCRELLITGHVKPHTSSSDSESDSDDSTSSLDRQETQTKGGTKYNVPSKGFIGPSIPSNLINETAKEHTSEKEDDDDDEDFSGIGPNPAFAGSGDIGSVASEFEQRAKRMKDKLLNKNEDTGVTERETWMTELPAQVANAFAGKS